MLQAAKKSLTQVTKQWPTSSGVVSYFYRNLSAYYTTKQEITYKGDETSTQSVKKSLTQVTKQWPTSSGIVSYFSSSFRNTLWKEIIELSVSVTL